MIYDNEDILDLGLDGKLYHKLYRNGIITVGDLKNVIKSNAIYNFRGIGHKNVKVLIDTLRKKTDFDIEGLDQYNLSISERIKICDPNSSVKEIIKWTLNNKSHNRIYTSFYMEISIKNVYRIYTTKSSALPLSDEEIINMAKEYIKRLC